MNDFLEQLLNYKMVMVPLDNPIAFAYTSLYEDGDVWVQIKGCTECLSENRKKCCGDCPMITEDGCRLHLEKGNKKPLHCIINPDPTQAKSYCVLQFRCIKGTNEGKIRRVQDKNGILIDGC